MFTTHTVLQVICHMSPVTCHMSHPCFRCHIFFPQASRCRVCYQRGLPRLVSINSAMTIYIFKLVNFLNLQIHSDLLNCGPNQTRPMHSAFCRMAEKKITGSFSCGGGYLNPSIFSDQKRIIIKINIVFLDLSDCFIYIYC